MTSLEVEADFIFKSLPSEFNAVDLVMLKFMKRSFSTLHEDKNVQSKDDLT